MVQSKRAFRTVLAINLPQWAERHALIEIPRFGRTKNKRREKNAYDSRQVLTLYIILCIGILRRFHDVIILCLAFLHVFFVIWSSAATSSGIPVYYDNIVHRETQTMTVCMCTTTRACYNIIYTRIYIVTTASPSIFFIAISSGKFDTWVTRDPEYLCKSLKRELGLYYNIIRPYYIYIPKVVAVLKK